MIGAGQLRDVITIQERAKGSDGYGGTIFTWSDFATVRAKRVPLRGRELIAAQAEHNETTVKFRLRYLDGVTPSMRIVCDGNYYDINAVIDIGGQGRELEVMAKTGMNEG